LTLLRRSTSTWSLGAPVTAYTSRLPGTVNYYVTIVGERVKAAAAAFTRSPSAALQL
jgi:hypothetical protein